MNQHGGNPIILDGGMGQELVRRSPVAPTPFWSGRVLAEGPDLVRSVHGAFIAAGADAITLNSYALTPQRLAQAGLADAFEDLQGRAVALARAARDDQDRPVRIAGCLPPLVASYRADLIPPVEECRTSYARIVESEAGGVDLFICETMSAIHEAEIATAAAAATGLPVWTAFTVDDGDSRLLRSGEPLREAVDAAVAKGAEAVLVNCSTPEATTQALEQLTAKSVVFGAYANGCTGIGALSPTVSVDVLHSRTDVTPEAYTTFCRHWLDAGATIVGGCCEVGPEHIRHLADALGRAPTHVEQPKRAVNG